VLWTSVGGGMTGEPVDGVLLIDDPLKDRAQAESANIRELHKDWFHGVVEPRCHPGASIIVMATRWHADDLSGYLVKEQGFRYINLKAIAEDDRPPGDNRQIGEALWPEKRPLSFLQERQRANVWNFASLFQGSPRPRGGAIFRDPTYYHSLPTRGFKVLYGLDLAYTERSHADFSVCVELWVVPPLRETDRPTIYVVNVDRKQVDAPAFSLTLKTRASARPGKMFWIASGTEKGVAQFMRKAGLPVVIRDPKGRDKLTRALGTAELWNLGLIQVPIDQAAHDWVEAFVDEVTSFSGVKDTTDDQVDALVSGTEEALKLDDLTLHFVPSRHT
jgi:phage terminase large subunit-like protein